jgi:hypothetical protein
MKIAPTSREHSLLQYADDVYSQNGEDGILQRIFEVVGTSSERCCEFGAWDGIHLSNTRALILDGWSGVFIEGDTSRAAQLSETYAEFPNVHCACANVDDDKNRLVDVLKRERLPIDFDLISIDIDGLDYEVFATLGVKARVVCVEVGGLHDPDRMVPVPRDLAMRNVGQPLARFRALGERMGYKLVCYTNNAIFVQRDIPGAEALNAIAPATAYAQNLARMSYTNRYQTYCANLGLTPPYRPFQNPYLTLSSLELPQRNAVRMVPVHRLLRRSQRAASLVKSRITQQRLRFM